MSKYKIINTTMAANSEAKIGDIVYKAIYCDYGCANDDTRSTGLEHISVTYKSDGQYPFFTIPKQHLEIING